MTPPRASAAGCRAGSPPRRSGRGNPPPARPPGGQPWYSPLAILTALTLRAVFHLALRQTEGLIGSIIGLLGLDLTVPDHSTLSRRAATLEMPRPQARRDGEPLHLLVDSTGLKLCGAGEWLLEKHGTKTRRAWRTLHIGTDADTGQIVAATLTGSDTSRFKRVIGDALCSRTDRRRATEVAIAVGVLNRMLDLGRPEYVRTA